MLDVHPPHEATHTWKDFLIHIATICVGLLIAIGLEQTVEAIHHRHQLAELREGLRQDNEKALRDEESEERYLVGKITWLTANLDDAREALRTKNHPHFIPYPKDLALAFNAILSVPVDPTWKAAKASNLIVVMPQEDLKAFAEIDMMIEHTDDSLNDLEYARRISAFREQFRVTGKNDDLDFSNATQADIVAYLALLNEERSNLDSAYKSGRYLRGALQAVLRGERDLDKIDEEENKVRDGPAVPPAK